MNRNELLLKKEKKKKVPKSKRLEHIRAKIKKGTYHIASYDIVRALFDSA